MTCLASDSFRTLFENKMSNDRAQLLAGIERALIRSGQKALWMGKRLGTPVWVIKNGRIVDATLTEPEPTRPLSLQELRAINGR
jgi:hypothetical protein